MKVSGWRSNQRISQTADSFGSVPMQICSIPSRSAGMAGANDTSIAPVRKNALWTSGVLHQVQQIRVYCHTDFAERLAESPRVPACAQAVLRVAVASRCASP
jgi:hypothetical protein